MTEDEAKTKWCPQARVGFADMGGTNSRTDGNVNCIVSACMAWRLTNLRDPMTQEINRNDGYCGLAGSPQ